MRLIVLPALVGLRLITGLMFFAAAGACAATVALSLSAGSRSEFLRPVAVFVISSAVIFGAGAVGTIMLMPGTAALIRQLPRDRDASVPVAFVLFLAALTGVSVLQMPSLAAWWTADLKLAQAFIGTSDPLGLYLVPTTLLVATASIATLGVLAFAIGGVLALVSPQNLIARVLTACLMTQGALVGGLYTVDRGLRALGAGIQGFVDSASDPAASTSLADWLSRYDTAPGALRGRLLWLLGGFVLAAILSSVMTRRRSSIEDEGDAFERELATEPMPPTEPLSGSELRSAGTPPVAITTDFEESAYSVRPRSGWLGPWVSRRATYDIASIPPTSRSRFSLSWTGESGVVRREPQGPDILSITAITSGLLDGYSLEVRDPRSGSTIGALVPVGSDWEVRDATGQAVAHALQIDMRIGRARFVAKAGDQELCRFVWGWTGLTAASAELQIEFLQDVDARLDKGLAIVLGALLDHQARQANRYD
ncbi:MAG: hypothetical protein ACM4AI_13060 [Acidobacteriota bacterium]